MRPRTVCAQGGLLHRQAATSPQTTAITYITQERFFGGSIRFIPEEGAVEYRCVAWQQRGVAWFGLVRPDRVRLLVRERIER